MWTVYKIVSPSSRVYVGSAKNFKKRMQRYKYLDCKNQVKLYRSLLKYGFNNHKIEVLEICQEADVYKRERYFGDLFNVLGESGLNISLPGYKEVPRVFSNEYREAVSKRVSGKGNPMYGRPSAMLGKYQTEAAKKLCRDAKVGLLNPMHGFSSFNSPKFIICVQPEYGIFMTLTEAAFCSGYSVPYMSEMINNLKPNKTKFILCKN